MSSGKVTWLLTFPAKDGQMISKLFGLSKATPSIFVTAVVSCYVGRQTTFTCGTRTRSSLAAKPMEKTAI